MAENQILVSPVKTVSTVSVAKAWIAAMPVTIMPSVSGKKAVGRRTEEGDNTQRRHNSHNELPVPDHVASVDLLKEW